MRRVLFELATIMASGGGEEIVLASVGYTVLTREFRKQHTPKSPLKQQLEYIQQSKELLELTGVVLRDTPGDRFQLDDVPETPSELGAQLGYNDNGRAVRRVLRRKFTDRPPHASWAVLAPGQLRSCSPGPAARCDELSGNSAWAVACRHSVALRAWAVDIVETGPSEKVRPL